jgi:SMODS and SLOG-associating 2TM effector domain 1
MPEPEVDAAATYAMAKEALAGGEAGIGQLGAAAERLREIAPEIGTILGSSEVSAHLGTYARCDEEAVRQQSRLFWETTAANLCLLAAAVLSSCVLAVPAIQAMLGETWTPRLLLAIGLTALLLGALAALYGYRAREGNRLLRWLNMRGRAEVARIDTFRAIAKRAAAAGPVAAAAGLALFCRHLFLEQRDWLVARAQRHRVSSDVTNRWGGLATALTFLGGSAATIAAFQDKMSWLALAGVVGTAFMAFALNREGLRRDRANADRYEEKAVALDQLSTRLDEVAGEIAAGRPEALTAFVDQVTAELETEHKQWLDGTKQVEAALASLDARLKELREARPKAGPALVVPLQEPDREPQRPS